MRKVSFHATAEHLLLGPSQNCLAARKIAHGNKVPDAREILSLHTNSKEFVVPRKLRFRGPAQYSRLGKYSKAVVQLLTHNLGAHKLYKRSNRERGPWRLLR